MSTLPESTASICLAAMAVTSLAKLLARGPAIVLERVAFGGGATNWYYCTHEAQLPILAARFTPGSVVSFYFDGRIRDAISMDEVRSIADRSIRETGDAVVGVLAPDGLTIDAQIVAGPNDLDDFASGLGVNCRLFSGAFPGRENDGVQAITITMPDADGIVRPHPH